ncbi:hypothetical protein TPA4_18 [Tsukamurella phage TPA4]|uniref:hypothetical protein n=1 Tax=Tsukamurella phage TPA4 TaxID=1647476 RepID=UPI0007B64F07|nr:hypothetical protein BH784_gp18 [Tsukamurella phage TPA4]AKJ72183.1 hypothetical protein TPA4_18 [Tsukamurella phage TPA4]
MSRSEWTEFDPRTGGRPWRPSFKRWNDMGEYQKYLQSRETKIVYVSPDGQRIYNLAGGLKGNRGVVLDEGLEGTTGSPFEQRYSNGPWLLGERPERTDFSKRVIQLGVHIGPHLEPATRMRYPNTSFAFRSIQEQWNDDWPEDVELPSGFWGEFTRYHGWRWTRVRIGEASRHKVERDPHYAGNYYTTMPMTIHAPFPFYTKRMLTREWQNSEENTAIFGKNRGILRLPNRGDYPQWPKYIVEGHGEVTIQDGLVDRMVEIPIRRADGMVLVDTEPGKRVLTAENDPVDTPLLQVIRNSDILDWLLGDLTQADAGLPIGQRTPGGVEFFSEIPAESMAVIKVTHSNPRGKITMLMPQWYRRGAAA